MKLFKLIATCVMATLLVISITLNILLLCGFKFTKGTEAEQTSDIPTKVYTSEVQTEHNKNTATESGTANNQTSSSENKGTTVEPIGVIYEDNNIKVTYLQTEDSPAGIVHNFEVENLSDKTLTVVFTDMYVNGHPVYSSGLTCEKLFPGTTVTEELVLLDKEYELSTVSEYDISFVVKLVNAKSCLDLYNSNRITLKF